MNPVGWLSCKISVHNLDVNFLTMQNLVNYWFYSVVGDKHKLCECWLEMNVIPMLDYQLVLHLKNLFITCLSELRAFHTYS